MQVDDASFDVDDDAYKSFSTDQARSAIHLLVQARNGKEMPSRCLWLGERYVELTGPPELATPYPNTGIHYPGQPITKRYEKGELQMTASAIVAVAKMDGICRPEEIGVFPLSREEEVQETARNLASGFVCELYEMPPEGFDGERAD